MLQRTTQLKEGTGHRSGCLLQSPHQHFNCHLRTSMFIKCTVSILWIFFNPTTSIWYIVNHIVGYIHQKKMDKIYSLTKIAFSHIACWDTDCHVHAAIMWNRQWHWHKRHNLLIWILCNVLFFFFQTKLWYLTLKRLFTFSPHHLPAGLLPPLPHHHPPHLSHWCHPGSPGPSSSPHPSCCWCVKVMSPLLAQFLCSLLLPNSVVKKNKRQITVNTIFSFNNAFSDHLIVDQLFWFGFMFSKFQFIFHPVSHLSQLKNKASMST